MKMTIKKLGIIITVSAMCLLVGCKGSTENQVANNNEKVIENQVENKTITIVDREGKEIVIPDKVDRIISMAPSVTETLITLGLSDKIVAVDSYSKEVEGVDQNIPEFDMMSPDTESIASLKPDLVFTTGMSKSYGEDPFSPLAQLGILMTAIPSSTNIEAIREDILFIGEVTNKKEECEKLVESMNLEIKEILDKVNTLDESQTGKTVYFEIAAAPDLVTFGKDVFLDEIISLLKAKNIVNEQSWVSISEEAVIKANPDIIFTNVDYIENPIEEIKSRTGWEVVNGVKENRVYSIDKNASSRPNEKIVKAIEEMATAIYPELFNK